MLEKIIQDAKFGALMKNNIENLIHHFFDTEQHFGILCQIENVSFEPTLPEDINSEFRPLTLFFLAGYTFETAQVVEDMLVFEAGFGVDNIGSIVSVPLLSILQIIVDETPLLINLATYQKKTEVKKESGDSGVKNSMASFLANPENSKFVKK